MQYIYIMMKLFIQMVGRISKTAEITIWYKESLKPIRINQMKLLVASVQPSTFTDNILFFSLLFLY